jgi:regulator of protease activity HflC (stomatin/prohibitin superfamily)
MTETGKIFSWSLVGLIILSALVAGGMWGCPTYNVWQQGLAGQAELQHAMQSKQVAIQEAHAKLESATLLANAEIERAKGVAEANKIIGESLHGNDAYLRYLWITEVAAVGRDGKTVVYVPTEANLPILEATRAR